MIGGVTRHMLLHLSGVPHLNVYRPLVQNNRVNFMSLLFSRLQFKFSVHLSGFIG